MKAILIGFDELEAEGIKLILKDLCESVIPGEQSVSLKVKEALNSSSDTSSNWSNSKIVIIHDGERYIREVMNRVKSLKPGRVIFATTTPVSLEWKLKDLIKELEEEDKYFRGIK